MNEQLLQWAESLVSVPGHERSQTTRSLRANVDKDYMAFLELRNSGYTPDGFFHFFGRSGPVAHNVFEWNQPDVWRYEFAIEESSFVVAEDLLGNQYYLTSGSRQVVKTLWVDDGKSTLAAGSFVDFVDDIVEDESTLREYRLLTNEFCRKSGKLVPQFCHLSYKIPVCLGGRSNDLHNLEVMDSLTHLLICGQIASQVATLRPGTKIKSVEVIEGRLRLICNDHNESNES